MNITIGIKQLGGCEYYRTLVPYNELRRRGHRVVWFDRIVTEQVHESMPVGTIFARDPKNELHIVKGADLCVVQRLSDRGLLDACRAVQTTGTKIVYEFDDNFHSMPSHNPQAKLHGPASDLTRCIDDFVGMADLVVVSTDGLANEYARQRGGRPMVVAHNALDDSAFRLHRPAITGQLKRQGQIRIGWAGSPTHLNDMRLTVPALCKLLDEFPELQIVFLGADLRGLFPQPYFKPSVFKANNRVEFIPGDYTTTAFELKDLASLDIGPLRYIELLKRAQFDIAIAPIESNTFNRGKSWVKVLEYGMVGIPTVASNFGPYREYKAGGGQILLADSTAEWHRALRSLIVDETARLRLAFNNREHIEAHHLISRGADTWETALQSVMREPVLA
jgi:glycosyltransferase involved in cell wall biosynthesis